VPRGRVCPIDGATHFDLLSVGGRQIREAWLDALAQHQA
jgi:hypothetical protein